MTGPSPTTNQLRPYPADVKSGRFRSSSLPATHLYNRELYRLRASRLVDFFPDELVIQEKTISVIRRNFLVSFIETLPVKDIGRVVYVDTPFFASLQILGKNPTHDLHIRGLYRGQARQAEQAIEALLIEEKNAVDIPVWLQTDDRQKRLIDAEPSTEK
jgi:hypothetical protein